MIAALSESTEIPTAAGTMLPGAIVVSERIPGARQLAEDSFAAATCDAYQSLQRQALQRVKNNFIRIWNFVPGIHDSVGNGRDRYMAFNAGRYRAMSEWFGNTEALLANAPAATGVGWSGDDLVIHALVSDQPGTALQNPRQTPSVNYSARYGPLPPSFARATRVNDVLLISGTAAITGEDSEYAEDLSRQWDLSLENIRRLIVVPRISQRSDVLGALKQVRIYLPNAKDESWINAASQNMFSAVKNVEIVRADLCRSELLVEIEGIAIADGHYE